MASSKRSDSCGVPRFTEVVRRHFDGVSKPDVGGVAPQGLDQLRDVRHQTQYSTDRYGVNTDTIALLDPFRGFADEVGSCRGAPMNAQLPFPTALSRAGQPHQRRSVSCSVQKSSMARMAHALGCPPLQSGGGGSRGTAVARRERLLSCSGSRLGASSPPSMGPTTSSSWGIGRFSPSCSTTSCGSAPSCACAVRYSRRRARGTAGAARSAA